MKIEPYCKTALFIKIMSVSLFIIFFIFLFSLRGCFFLKKKVILQISYENLTYHIFHTSRWFGIHAC